MSFLLLLLGFGKPILFPRMAINYPGNLFFSAILFIRRECFSIEMATRGAGLKGQLDHFIAFGWTDNNLRLIKLHPAAAKIKI